MDKNLTTLGDRIRSLRKSKGLTMEEFGKLFDASKSIVSRWERNISEPNAKRLKHIAKLAGVSVDELLYGEGYTPERVEQMLENNPNELEQVFNKLFIEDLEDLSFLDDDVRKFITKILNTGHTLPDGRMIAGDDYKEYLASNVFKSIKKSRSSTDKIKEGDIKFSKDTQINFLSNYIRMKDPLTRDYYFSELLRIIGKQKEFKAKELLIIAEQERKYIQKRLKWLDSLIINESDQDTISKYEQIIDIITRVEKELENISAALKKL